MYALYLFWIDVIYYILYAYVRYMLYIYTYTCVLVGRPSFFLVPQGWATTPRTAWTSRPRLARARFRRWKKWIPGNFWIWWTSAAWRWAGAWGGITFLNLLDFFWLWVYIWYRSAWGDFLWFFFGWFWMLKICNSQRTRRFFPWRPGCSEPMMWRFPIDSSTILVVRKWWENPTNHPVVHHVPWSYESPTFRDIQTNHIVDHISHHIPKNCTSHVYPCFSIFSMCKNPKSCWLKVPKSLAFRHSFVTPEAPASHSSPSSPGRIGWCWSWEWLGIPIDLTTGISWVFEG